jgi:hypothetical protein
MIVRFLGLILLLLPPFVGGNAEEPTEPPTNLQVMQRIAANIGRGVRLLIPLGRDSCASVLVLPHETAWPLEQDFVRAIVPAGSPDTGVAGSRVAVELGILESRVLFEEPRRDGFFGPKIIDRIVHLSVRAKIEVSTRAPLFQEFRGEARDTVRVSELERLETPGLLITRGIVPSQGFFGDLLEPLILLGSVGVAVYLLFAVKS